MPEPERLLIGSPILIAEIRNVMKRICLASIPILLLPVLLMAPALANLNNPPPPIEESFRLLIKKGERKLYVYQTVNGKEKLAWAYSIALGNTPTGHKTRQGDGRTPEGDYYITHKNPKSNFYLSLGVSYPNIRDADEGLENGFITKAQHEAITAAIRSQSKPPQNTRLGGDIFIHGGGTGKLLGLIRDWTLGCVALENKDIKELFDLLPVKTPVKIAP
jgi:murein L,D-transpeptidase YafK